MTTPRTSTRGLAAALLASCLALAALDAAAATPGEAGAQEGTARTARPHWAVDPAAPGDDLPPRGRSLFDFLVAQDSGGQVVQVVPFPFSALVQRLNAQLRGDSPAKAVLIPLGRSLQRNSAAPEYFAYPRAVVAADGEAASTRALHVKDRLYLGYQEKANVLEVISYNEEAGRFEFQVVTDYRAGGTPRIVYANRVLCVACHQNAAPIFSRPVWDETNANPRIASRLRAQGREYYGIAVDRGIDIPNAIDDAALRAGRFAALQLVWDEGCDGADAPAQRCRAGLFAALLQYRLSGQQDFDRDDAAYRVAAAPRVLQSAKRRWPGGLALGNPDIPNRSPLPDGLGPSAVLDARELLAYANVAAPFDPLEPRAPLEVWRIDGADDVARAVAGLAEFVSDADMRQLDHELFKRGAASAAARTSYRAPCRVDPVPASGREQRIEFRCGAASGEQGTNATFNGRLIVSGNAVKSATIDRLQLEGQAALHDIDLVQPRVERRGAERSASFEPRRGALHARRADGNALERFELRWGGANGASASLVVLDDFAVARRGVDALASKGGVDFDGLGPAPLRRAKLMPALFEGIGAARGEWCCLDASRLPPAQAARTDVQAEGASRAPAEAHAAFYRYCGECHLSNDRAPPNFLLGDAREVEAKLQQCAPRMYVRLRMWQREAGARAKSPMPPEVALHRFEVGARAWREGDALAGLLRSVGARLRGEGASAAQIEALATQGYESLRACLPDDAATASPQRELPAASQSPKGTS